MKVTAIRYAGKTDVYNMEVADTHDYAIENGAIVHNCRYMVTLIKPRINVPIPITAHRRRLNPLDFREVQYPDGGKIIELPDIIVG